MPATDYANDDKKTVTGLVIPGSIGEAVKDHAAATMTWS